MNITKLEDLLELSEVKSISNGTSLITYYVLPNIDLSLITKHLSSELSTSKNIKDKNIRYRVGTALKSLIQKLNNIRNHKSPENGLVLCAGETEYCI